MIHGSYSVPRVVEESYCRTTQDYRFTEIGIYRIHSIALMPNIPFGESLIEPNEVDSSIFDNDKDTKLIFNPITRCQNYLTTRYIGRAPLEYYANGETTLMGRQFILICRDGNPTENYRVFGTEAAIRGYNREANENVKMPGG